MRHVILFLAALMGFVGSLWFLTGRGPGPGPPVRYYLWSGLLFTAVWSGLHFVRGRMQRRR